MEFVELFFEKIREALENLNEKIDGVVTTYNRPYTHDDHEAITMNMVVMAAITTMSGPPRTSSIQGSLYQRSSVFFAGMKNSLMACS